MTFPVEFGKINIILTNLKEKGGEKWQILAQKAILSRSVVLVVVIVLVLVCLQFVSTRTKTYTKTRTICSTMNQDNMT